MKLQVNFFTKSVKGCWRYYLLAIACMSFSGAGLYYIVLGKQA